VKIRAREWLKRGVAFCPPEDEIGCLRAAAVLEDSPPSEEPEPEHPDSIPPEDIGECHVCMGQGERPVGKNWAGPYVMTVTCTWCGGTGEEPR
jgi:hypothetical protein